MKKKAEKVTLSVRIDASVASDLDEVNKKTGIVKQKIVEDALITYLAEMIWLHSRKVARNT